MGNSLKIKASGQVPKDEIRFVNSDGTLAGLITGMGEFFPDEAWPFLKPDACPKCGHVLKAGEWPWCKGDPKDHDGKPAYGWKMG